MKFSEALLIIKEFFLEVLGFLIPGLIMLILPVFILKGHAQDGIFSIFDEKYHLYIVILFAYVLGYTIYGASEMLESVKWDREKGKLQFFLGYCFFSSYKLKLEESIGTSTNFKTAKKKLAEIGGIEGHNSDIKVRQVRNLAMSFISKAEKSGIYTFTFRSDLCRHLSTVLKCYISVTIILMILNLIPSISKALDDYLILNKIWFFIVLIAFFSIFILFLEKTRRRFYSIAHRIPYSMFIATIKNIRPKEEDEE